MLRSTKSLGTFLKSRRLKIDPLRLGIKSSGARRTTGLRREEVAERAGISTEWYVKLEQGKALCPSNETLVALGTALLLDDTEREHMLRLASPAAGPEFMTESLPVTLSRMIAQLEQPAYVTGERWDILAWNRAADNIFKFSALPEEDKNILLYMLTDQAKTVFGLDWLKQTKRIVSLFRPVYDRRAGDAAFESLKERLYRDCPNFPEWWTAYEINVLGTGIKTLYFDNGHATSFDHASFSLADMPSLRLALYTPRQES